jgi:hypothetical protein
MVECDSAYAHFHNPRCYDDFAENQPCIESNRRVRKAHIECEHHAGEHHRACQNKATRMRAQCEDTKFKTRDACENAMLAAMETCRKNADQARLAATKKHLALQPKDTMSDEAEQDGSGEAGASADAVLLEEAQQPPVDLSTNDGLAKVHNDVQLLETQCEERSFQVKQTCDDAAHKTWIACGMKWDPLTPLHDVPDVRGLDPTPTMLRGRARLSLNDYPPGANPSLKAPHASSNPIREGYERFLGEVMSEAPLDSSSASDQGNTASEGEEGFDSHAGLVPVDESGSEGGAGLEPASDVAPAGGNAPEGYVPASDVSPGPRDGFVPVNDAMEKVDKSERAYKSQGAERQQKAAERSQKAEEATKESMSKARVPKIPTPEPTFAPTPKPSEASWVEDMASGEDDKASESYVNAMMGGDGTPSPPAEESSTEESSGDEDTDQAVVPASTVDEPAVSVQSVQTGDKQKDTGQSEVKGFHQESLKRDVDPTTHQASGQSQQASGQSQQEEEEDEEVKKQQQEEEAKRRAAAQEAADNNQFGVSDDGSSGVPAEDQPPSPDTVAHSTISTPLDHPSVLDTHSWRSMCVALGRQQDAESYLGKRFKSDLHSWLKTCQRVYAASPSDKVRVWGSDPTSLENAMRRELPVVVPGGALARQFEVHGSRPEVQQAK